MSIAFLDSLLRQSEDRINAGNIVEAKDVAKQVASKANFDKLPPTDIVKKLSYSRDDLKKAHDKFKDLVDKARSGNLEKLNKFATSEDISKVKESANKTLQSLSTVPNLNISEADIKAAADLMSSCTSLSNLGSIIGRASGFNQKKALNLALAEPTAQLVLDIIDSKLIEFTKAMSELINSAGIKGKAKTSDEAAELLVAKLKGQDFGSKASNEIMTKAIDTVQQYQNDVSLIANRTIDKFNISESEKRGVVETATQILDLTSLEKVWADDLYIVMKGSDIIDKGSLVKEEARLREDISRFCKVLVSKCDAECERLASNRDKTYLSGRLGKLPVWAFTNIINKDSTGHRLKITVDQLYSYDTRTSVSTFNHELAAGLQWNTGSKTNWTMVKKVNTYANNLVSKNHLPHMLSEASISKDSPLVELLKIVDHNDTFFDAGHINSVELSSVGAHTTRRVLSSLTKGTYSRTATINTMKVLRQELLEDMASGDMGKKFLNIFKESVRAELANKLAEEYITGELELTRILTDDKLLAKLETSYNLVTPTETGSEFIQVFKNLIDIGHQATSVRIEQAVLNRWFGVSLQSYLADAKREYHRRLLQKMKAFNPPGAGPFVFNGVKYDSLVDFKGSKSAKELLTDKIVKNLTGQPTVGASTLVTKVTSKRKKSKAQVIASVTYKLSNKGKVEKVSLPKEVKKSITPTKVTSQKSSVKGSSTVSKSPPKRGTLPTNVSRLRRADGKFTSIANIRSILELNLFDTIRKNMVKPALRYRTGRFAKSVEVKDVQQANGIVDIRYTYMKYPYQTFEPGYNQGTAERDPRKLIGESIREVLRTQVLNKLRITRV